MAEPEWYAGFEKQYLEQVLPQAEQALKQGDWPALAAAADTNHQLLQQLTVSCPELDDLVLKARAAGALGAKMAGTGRGGLMFAICGDDQALQDKVFAALDGVAPQVWRTSFA